MTAQELEQELLNLSPGEKLRIIQLLLQSLGNLWNAIVPPASPKALIPQRSPVSILNQLAAINACSSIPDPVSWQREQRQDRELPGREP
jgi:hypothetical protein